MDTADYNLIKGNQVFITWKWTWLESADIPCSDTEDNLSVSDNGQPDIESPDNSDNESDDSIPATTHSVIFKCIGCNKELRYQELLALAKRKMQDSATVPVKLHHEPDNPKDTKAIAFMCKVEDDWERIGYIFKEALDDVHKAINANKLISVSFQWIKKLFTRTPGWYAGIRITRSGDWSDVVLRSRARNYES